MNEPLLARIPLFSDLPITELAHLSQALQVVEVPPQTVIFREGDAGSSLYVVVEGELEVLMAVGLPDEMLLSTLGPGECVGEMSLLLPEGQRSATVRSRNAARLLVMTRQEFNDLLQRQPLMVYAVVGVLSKRLGASDHFAFRELTERNHRLQQAYHDLKAAQAQLIEKERLDRELQVASEIQTSILPDTLPVVPGFEFGAVIDPARQVGGDLFDIFPVGPDTIGVLIGDVADKGVPAAIFMARVHALMVAEAVRGAPAKEVLREVNRQITQLAKSIQFVTTLYGILNLRTAEFTYARAGHEPPLLLTPEGRVERLPYKPGMALGIVEDIQLDEQTIRLIPGSSLLLHTDGLTDCRNREGEPFGQERAQVALASLRGSSAQDVCDHMLAVLKEHECGAAQDDDVTLVVVQAG